MKCFLWMMVAACMAGFQIKAYGQSKSMYFENLSVADGLSQLSVVSIFQDTEGYMWFGTRDGLNRYNGYEFEVFKHDPTDETSISANYIRCISEDWQGNLWIGTTNGLNRYNAEKGTFTRYYINPRRNMGNFNEINSMLIDSSSQVYVGTYSGMYRLNPARNVLEALENVPERVYNIISSDGQLYVGTSSGITVYNPKTGQSESFSPFSTIEPKQQYNQVNTLFQDSKHRIWMGSINKGLALLDKKTGKIAENVSLSVNALSSQNEIRKIIADRAGNLVIGTYEGLRIYDPDKRSVDVYDQLHTNNTSAYAVEDIFIDRAGIMWVGTYSGGVNYQNELGNRFQFYNPAKNRSVLGIIGCMIKEGNHLWMGTEAGGLVLYDLQNEQFSYYPFNLAKENYKESNVKSMVISGHSLFIGVYTGWLYEFDLLKRRFVSRVPNEDKAAIYCIQKTGSANEFLLGTYSIEGLKLYTEGKIQTYGATKKGAPAPNVSQVSALLRISDHDIYAGTRSNGLYHIMEGSLKQYSKEDNRGLTGNRITSIYKDHQGTILIGTADGGLNRMDPKTNRFKSISHKDGLNDDMICSIIEDLQHRLWIITRRGISQLDSAYRVVRTFGQSSGIKIQEFSVNSACIMPDNTIYAGGDNGFISFNPNNLKHNSYIPPVVINTVTVNNKPVPKKFDDHSTLELDHDESNISIAYSSLNYIYPNQNRYAYFMEGVDNVWNEVGNMRIVNYANLAPGRYTFRVRGSNNDGLWNKKEARLQLVIHAPVWQRGWAIGLYALVLMGVLYTILRQYHIRQSLRQQVYLKQQEEKLYQARIDLFTSFSHEFRTPLTLISGPVEDALMANNAEVISRASLQLIHNNIKRILLLVDQLMTFRKKENGALEVRVAQGDFVGFAKEMTVAFRELARNNQIQLNFEVESMPRSVWYDRSLFEKVLMNLLANAFKFTPRGGTVTLRIRCVKAATLHTTGPVFPGKLFEEAEQYLEITVEDNGPGLGDQELVHIFDPFYQASNAQGGTGIGLSLSKDIVEMHRGTIWAENGAAGGLRFIILLPEGNRQFQPEEIITDYRNSEDISHYLADEALPGETPHQGDHCILVVEDNHELLKYIQKSLQPYYKVLVADNGKLGKSIAISSIPALIISDVMMPVMDGLEMCRELKNDARTAHIPIILLTARAYLLQMKEGLELGADDYITKPFQPSLLLLKVRNMIASRENFRNLYGKRLSLENMGVDVASSDDKFLQKLNSVVERHIQDPNLNIERFCDEIGMSRASLYRKLMATANMSPSKYLQTIRLHMSTKMLRETDMSVSDVAYAVGFNSLIHFSASFKKQYGVSPSKYKKP